MTMLNEFNNIKFDFEKFVHSSIDRIEDFKKESAFTILTPGLPLTDSIAIVSYEDDEKFKCKFYLKKIYGQEYLHDPGKFGFNDDLLFDRSGYPYLIKKNTAVLIRTTVGVPQVLEAKLFDFQSAKKDFNNTYIRLVIPTEDDVSLGTFDCKSCKIGETITFCGLIEIQIEQKNYHLFKYTNNDTRKHYCIIDSLAPTSLEPFKKDADSIILACGFFSGNLFLDEYYYETCEEQDFKLIKDIRFTLNKASIITGRVMLDRIRFQEYLKVIKREDLFKKYPPYINTSVFNNMCRKVQENEDFSRLILLVLEGTQTKYITLRCGIYSIALETLTNIIYEENEDNFNPISDKNLSKLIRKKMLDVIEENSTTLSSYGKSILLSKINDLNKPTNTKKLERPFDIYKIPLNEDDKLILSHRNKFLHGTIPLSENEILNEDHEIKYISLKMLVLIDSLILKYIGYSGHIINFAAWYRVNTTKEKIKEHLFKII
jgi:hypothetical protein